MKIIYLLLGLRLSLYMVVCLLCLGNAVLGFIITIQGGDGFDQMTSALLACFVALIISEKNYG